MQVFSTESFGWAGTFEQLADGKQFWPNYTGTIAISQGSGRARFGDGQGFMAIAAASDCATQAANLYPTPISTPRILFHIAAQLDQAEYGSSGYMGWEINSNGSAPCAEVHWNAATKTFQLYRNGVLLGESVPYTADGWHSLQINAYLHATAGTVKVWIDEVLQISYVGNTSAPGSGGVTFTNLTLRGFTDGNRWMRVQDLKLAIPDDSDQRFIGDVRLKLSMPSGAGSSAQWTANGAAAPWQAVNEIPRSDTTYVRVPAAGSTSTTGQIDMHATSGVGISGSTVTAVVQKALVGFANTANNVQVRQRIKSGATTQTGTARFAMPSAYQAFVDRWETDPATGLAWTPAAAQAIEIGYETASTVSAYAVRVTQAFVEIEVPVREAPAPPAFIADTESFGWATDYTDLVAMGAFLESTGTLSFDSTATRYGDGQRYLRVHAASWCNTRHYDELATSRCLFHASLKLNPMESGSGTMAFHIASTVGLECHVEYDRTARRFRAYRGAMLLGQSRVYGADQWVSLQVNAYLHTSAGSLRVWVDEVLQIEFAGDTCDAGGTTFEFVRFECSFSYMRIADWKIGVPANSTSRFPGDVRLRVNVSSGPGSSAQFTAVGAAAPWQAVNEIPQNGDNSYAQSSTPGQKDLHATSSLGIVGGTVNAVVRKTLARKDGVGLTELRQLTRSGSTTHNGQTVALSTTYTGLVDRLETDPDTGLPWQITAAQTAPLGYELVTME